MRLPHTYRKAKARIGGNGRANSRPQSALEPSRFDLGLRPAGQFRVGERNTTQPGGSYWCRVCRRRATYLVRQPRTCTHAWACQDCTDLRKAMGL